MTDFLGLPQNQPFVTALLVMLGIAILEGVATLLWGGISQVVDSLIPDFDLDADLDVQADSDAHVEGGATPADAGVLTPLLAWLQIGKVPILVLLVLFLTGFGLSGLALQRLVQTAGGSPFPASLVALPAIAVGAFSLRLFGGWIARLMPKEETSAVSRETFVGRIATVVLGVARRGAPTQARLRDEYGRAHYVMIEPDLDTDEFAQGAEVLIVSIQGAIFRVIEPSSRALLASNQDTQ
jgi:hypothetical protein